MGGERGEGKGDEGAWRGGGVWVVGAENGGGGGEGGDEGAWRGREEELSEVKQGWDKEKNKKERQRWKERWEV